ncbi:RNA pyrophosphohydrolase [Methyloceanibacter caenitepidi]|uniref:RNA pyrophosphohydrolase n=1 Tax=Methyloceanibacter caenitepidi TaxID=1384459 RepID=A0A0A8K0R0_9HYPH|nr:RNA pyrophosphohydrolase [Methyloceanibacter caenitepidi]BAQ15589.1 adenosine (5')-pentaphospho-(5'')-adenosine pyrophosphohydrolase [Methyloceanibacter caenitepidi]
MTDSTSLPYRPCAGVMLLNADGHVFVGRRPDRGDGDAEGRGKWWQMPQGGIDKGEAPEDAARRELWEETGVREVTFLAQTEDWLVYDLPPELVGVAWKGKYRGQKQMWFAARFEGPESDIDLRPRPDHKAEFDAWRWVPMAELPSLVVPFKQAVYTAVVDAFSHLVSK